MPTVTIGANTGLTYSGQTNASLVQIDPTTNWGDHWKLEVSKYQASDWRTTLLKFSGLSNITAPVTVSSATLYVAQGLSTLTVQNITFSLRRVLRDWVTAQATWNVYSTGNSWTTGGCRSDGNDRSSTVTATSPAFVDADYEVYKAITSAQLAQDVQDWINGVNPNYGWVLERADNSNDTGFIEFRNGDPLAPYLSVTYTAAGGGGRGGSRLLLGVG